MNCPIRQPRSSVVRQGQPLLVVLLHGVARGRPARRGRLGGREGAGDVELPLVVKHAAAGAMRLRRRRAELRSAARSVCSHAGVQMWCAAANAASCALRSCAAPSSAAVASSAAAAAAAAVAVAAAAVWEWADLAGVGYQWARVCPSGYAPPACSTSPLNRTAHPCGACSFTS